MNHNDLKRTEQTLQRLTCIVEQLKEGVAVTNLNGTIRFANPAMARMHGYNACRELITKSITHLYSDDQVQGVLKSMIETVRDRGSVQQSIAHTRQDGSTFPAQTKMVLLNDEQGRAVGLMVLVTDLSQWTQQESLTRHVKQLESANDQLVQQVRELKQALEYDPEEEASFDPNEQFGSPLSIRRHLAAAKRHPSQKQRSDTLAPADELELNKDHLCELTEIAKLLRG
ncbi:MAG: PAS domain-containing protein [Planctomycetota bacterium]|jgi:PAS domain S-box-containing protein